MKISLKFTHRVTFCTGLTIVATLLSVATPAPAQIGIYIGTPPPPVRYERRPPIPGQGYIWTDGYYEPYNNRYRWHPGYWQQPPYPNAYYSHPHYDHYPEGWRLHEGHWDHEDHGDHRDERNDHRDNRNGDKHDDRR